MFGLREEVDNCYPNPLHYMFIRCMSSEYTILYSLNILMKLFAVGALKAQNVFIRLFLSEIKLMNFASYIRRRQRNLLDLPFHFLQTF